MSFCHFTGALGNIPGCATDPGAPLALLIFIKAKILDRSDLTEKGIDAMVRKGECIAILKGFGNYTAENTDANITEMEGSGEKIINASQKIGGNIIFRGDPCIAKVANRYQGKGLHYILITTNGYVGWDTNISTKISTMPIRFGAISIDSPVLKNTGDNLVTMSYTLGDVQILVRRNLFVQADINVELLSGIDVVKLYNITSTSVLAVDDCNGVPFDFADDVPTFSATINGTSVNVTSSTISSTLKGVINFVLATLPVTGDRLGIKIEGTMYQSEWTYAIMT